MTETLVIPSATMQGSRVCLALTIIGDDVAESNETFAVVLAVNSTQDAIAGQSTVSVIILEDDGMKECILHAHNM